MYHGQVVIGGNLTADPQLQQLSSGKQLCKFAVASNRYYRNSEKELIQETAFINVETWDTLAQTCSMYLNKGKKVRVIGRLKQERWQTEDESHRERHCIVAEHVEFNFDAKASEQVQKEPTTEEKEVKRGKRV